MDSQNNGAPSTTAQQKDQRRVFDENDRKHLDYLQAVITRMNSNSFTIKGWAITLVSALLALAASGKEWYYLLIPAVPIYAFWKLDSIFLEQERKFRVLYNEAIKPDSRLALYDMDIRHKAVIEANINTREVFLSDTMKQFYRPLILITLGICAIGIACKIFVPSTPAAIQINDTVKVQQVK